MHIVGDTDCAWRNIFIVYLELNLQSATKLLPMFLLQEAKAHREKELKKAEEDLNKAKKKAEESTKSMKEKQQVVNRD